MISQSNSQIRHRGQNSRRRTASLVAVLALLFSVPGAALAGLIVNELFRGSNPSSSYIEFLVTADMTLSELDSIWFGDSQANTNTVDHENQFNSAQIIANVGAFNSTSDVLRAGTILTVGGSSITTDFTYNPDSNDPTNSDSWNITLTSGQGFDATGGGEPFKLDQNGDVVWVASSQPSAGAGVGAFLSAVAYGSNPGALAQQVDQLAQSGDSNFQLVTGTDFDGKLDRNFSLSNTGGAQISFGESPGGTLGDANGGTNDGFNYDLRAVPEPSAVIPCLLALAFGFYFRWKKSLPKSVQA